MVITDTSLAASSTVRAILAGTPLDLDAYEQDDILKALGFEADYEPAREPSRIRLQQYRRSLDIANAAILRGEEPAPIERPQVSPEQATVAIAWTWGDDEIVAVFRATMAGDDVDERDRIGVYLVDNDYCVRPAPSWMTTELSVLDVREPSRLDRLVAAAVVAWRD